MHHTLHRAFLDHGRVRADAPLALPTALILALSSALLLALSSAAMLLTLGAAPAAALSFAPASHSFAGLSPVALAVGDFNGDGRPDVATANTRGHTVGVLLGIGRGRLATRVPYGTGMGPRSVAVGDFDGDGHQDLAVANGGEATVSVLLGDGDGRFARRQHLGVGPSPAAVAVGDFNGDGDQDLVSADYDRTDGTASVLLGDGAGGFAPRIVVPTGPNSYDIAVGDFDRDGRQDLATVFTDFFADQGVGVLMGDGTGHFSSMTTHGTYLEPVAIAIGDLNADGRQDLVAAQRQKGSGELGVFLGDDVFRFRGGISLQIEPEILCVALGDLNSDGRQDVATAKGRSAVVLRGDGQGGLTKLLTFPVGAHPADVAIADFNRDGLPDLATADAAEDSVSVLLNGPAAAPVLRTLSPGQGRVGAVVTLTGIRVGLKRGAGVVRFGGATATSYVSWSSTKIRVRVPAGTAWGWVQATVRTVAGTSASKSFRRP